jgi:outer membrane protein OmpA-like peptidoglycan-associated protein
MILLLALAAMLPGRLRADVGDTDNSHDYPGFTRPHGFIITDYTEDNPAAFDFSISRPQPVDSAHLDNYHVTGHRFVIRYAPASGNPPLSLIQTQRYYENLAMSAGFAIEKTGATGDVDETFLLRKPGRAIWVSLEPGASAYVLTVLESTDTPPAALAVAPTPAVAPPVTQEAAPSTEPVAAPPISPASAPGPVASGPEDSLYVTLTKDGHVVLPISFLPAKPDVDDTAQPVINRVVAIMKRHPTLVVTIEGHTDSTGDPDYNKTLSLQRAKAVRTLVMSGGVPKARLLVAGLGGTDPVADDGTADGRQQNRRIELVQKTP